MIARVWHSVIVVLVLVALLIQTHLALKASGVVPPGGDLGRLAGASPLGRIIRQFSFFTVQSNILSAIVSAQLAMNAHRDGPGWRVLRLDALFGITVTGLVYATVLAPVHNPRGWQEVWSNFFVHYAVPVMMVVGWIVWGPRPRITARVVGLSLIWPVGWLTYTLIRGEIWPWYPYPFLNVPDHGYATVLINAVAVTIVFGLVAALFALGDRTLKPAPKA